MNMDIRNSVPFDGDDSEHLYYMIIDTKSHLADDCFDRWRVDVEYREEWHKEKSPYVIRECRIGTDDKKAFQAAMRELMVAMHISGMDDYRSVCEKLSKDAELMAERSDTDLI